MIKGGYQGKILRVDLTKGTITTEDLPDESILRKYIGGWGLGLWYLINELPTGVTALEPENPLIFMNGPLVGTKIPNGNNCSIATLNADTGYTAGRSHSHGWFGPFLSRAGLDGIIITGASDKWTYLWIDDDIFELRDAEKLVGKDTHETEDLIKKELNVPNKVGAAGGVSVAAIGPAGENLCAGALIENDKNHTFAHSGVGTVMGSKRLKAIAVRGTGEVRVADKEKVAAAAKKVLAWTKGKGAVQYVGNAGIARSDYAGVRAAVGLSAKNWLANDIPGFGNRMSQQKITSRPCFQCSIACAYDVEILEGPHKGYVATLVGGGEAMEGAATIVGVGGDDCGTVFYLVDLNDRLGFEASSVGCSMAVAFEAYENGLLTKEDTDGLELKWGDAKVVETLIRRIAHKEGRFASMLADGPKISAQRVGLPRASVDIKGSGMNLHDWRRGWGILLGQITSGGSGWPQPGADCFYPEPDVGYPELDNPLNPYGKGKQVAKTGRVKFWNDCIGICWFLAWGIGGVTEVTADAVATTVGWDELSPEEALKVGHRVLNLERIFNMQHGLTAEDDINVSPRITDPAPVDAGPAAGLSIAPYIEGWVRDYYQELGWDRKTGKPLRSTLKELEQEEFIDTVWD